MIWVGYCHKRADERLGNPPPGNQEPLVVKTKMEEPQVRLQSAGP